MDNKTYVNILVDTLIKKESVIDDLIDLTTNQEEILKEEVFDIEAFDQTLFQKANKIEQLNQLDTGFEKVFQHVKDEIKNNVSDNKNQIVKLQGLITTIIEKSAKLQLMEKKNKNQFSACLMVQKKEVGQRKISNNVAANYYKNMSSKYQGESFFLDKKK
ncbi:MAG: hypothetical protein ACK5JH_03485 [Anaerocolumna sp.]